jgi:hypothetical protein
MLKPIRMLSASVLAFAAVLSACGGDDGGTAPPPTLTAPTGVTVTATSAFTAHVTWTAGTGATSYVVQRATGATGTNFEAVGTATTTAFDDSGLSPETQYRYRVGSVAGTTSSDFSTEATVTTPIAPVATQEVTADITTNTLWTSDKVYVLKGFIHVANGATLTIQPGTKIVGDFNTIGSSLFVLRGSQINAQGTATHPIVFTSSQPAGQRQGGDWGGLILLGNGVINRADPIILEGTGTGPSNPAIDYAGGTNNNDNSGVLRYVRVEFAGYATAPDAELNTFTFAAVGSATQLEYLQALNGLDDSFEIFGGALNGKYWVSYNSGDDHFDMSEGFVGHLQYLIAYQTRTVVPRPAAGNISADPQGVENDGCNGANCTAGQNSLPYTVPMLANATLIGPPASTTNSAGNIGMMLRRGTAGVYVNLVVSRWSRAAISLRDQTTLDQITAGRLILNNILITESPALFQAASGTTVQGTVDATANALEFQTATTATSLFVNVPVDEPAAGAALDFTPVAGSPAASGGLDAFTGAIADKAAGVVTPSVYRGATGAGGTKWWEGWTYFAVN